MSSEATEQLFHAIRQRDPDKVRQLVKGIPGLLTVRDERGISPLVLATYLNDVDTTRVLVEAGSDINAGGGNGTALMGVAFKGYTELASYLIEAGADTEITNAQGMKAADFARMGGHLELAAMLQRSPTKR